MEMGVRELTGLRDPFYFWRPSSSGGDLVDAFPKRTGS